VKLKLLRYEYTPFIIVHVIVNDLIEVIIGLFVS